MLEFIIGRAGTGKSRACLAGMRERMERDPLGPALVLLLPEHMTYEAERALAISMPAGKGFLRSFVFGFRRFARQVLLETGGMAVPRITDVGRKLLLKRILGKRKNDLKIFQRAAGQRGFSHSLSEAIQEIKSYGMDGERLAKAADGVEEPQLKDKLRDLALLAEDFRMEMKGRYNDNEDMMRTLAERLPLAEFLRGAEIWIDGFIFFNPQERRILEELLKAASHVHISLAMDADLQSPENLRQTGVFHRSWETMMMLRKMAENLGIPWEIRPMARSFRSGKNALCLLEKNLFAHASKPEKHGDGIFIVEAAVRRLEAEAVASDILRLCREEGYRYRDIGVLLREESYESLMDFVLEEHGIPFFRDGRRSAAHHPMAELIRSVFSALQGWRYDPLFRAFRTGFFPVTWEQLDRLENYVLEFGIRGKKRWLMEEDWPWHRHSLEEDAGEVDDRTAKVLQEVNFARRQVAGILASFQESMGAAKNVEQMTAALYGFLLDLKVPETLEEWALRAEDEGRLEAAMEHRKIWNDVMDLMDQLVEVSGAEKLSPGDYQEILEEGLDVLEIALIPPGLDYVSVSPFDQNSLGNSRAIYILGANEGVMPRRSREKGIFTDADRLRIRESGVEISSGGLEGSLAEKYLLYRGFTEAREYLWISYSLADAAGEGLAPSSLVERIRRMFPEAGFLSIPLENLADRELDEGTEFGRLSVLRLADGRQALSGLTSVLRNRRDHQVSMGWWQDVYNWLMEQESLSEARDASFSGLFAKADEEALPKDLAEALFAQHRCLRGSVTRFERFQSCPFQHFAQYGLRLKEQQEYRFQAMDLGTLLHGALREFGETLKAGGRRWGDVEDEECHAMCCAILKKLMPKLRNELLMSTAQYQHQQARILEVAERSIRRLVALDAVSRFHPQVYERSFGRGMGSMPPLTYFLEDGGKVEIMGQIDRMDFDESGKYFLVMDYKTGESAINLLEVYYGLRMQLLTYLLVAKNLLERTKEDMLPAGMLYFFLRYPMYTAAMKIGKEEARKEIGKKLRMPGWVLADEEVIRAIDSSQEFIQVRLTKSGIHASDMSKVKKAEDFAVLLDYVDYMLKDTGKRILSGDIAARPYRWKDRVPCSFCPYRAVCGFDLQIEGFQYRNLKDLSADELLDTMEWKTKGGCEDGVDRKPANGD